MKKVKRRPQDGQESAEQSRAEDAEGRGGEGRAGWPERVPDRDGESGQETLWVGSEWEGGGGGCGRARGTGHERAPRVAAERN